MNGALPVGTAVFEQDATEVVQLHGSSGLDAVNVYVVPLLRKARVCGVWRRDTRVSTIEGVAQDVLDAILCTHAVGHDDELALFERCVRLFGQLEEDLFPVFLPHDKSRTRQGRGAVEAEEDENKL